MDGPLAAGGASLHACMTPHGPDTKTFEGATAPEAEQVAHLPRQAPAALAPSLIFLLARPRINAGWHVLVRLACLPHPACLLANCRSAHCGLPILPPALPTLPCLQRHPGFHV